MFGFVQSVKTTLAQMQMFVPNCNTAELQFNFKVQNFAQKHLKVISIKSFQ